MSFASTNSGMAGCGTFDTGHRTPRTRDWSRPPESETVTPKSQTEILADIYLAAHDRRQAEARAEEAKKAAAEQAARLQRQQDALRAQREVESEKKKRELDERRAQFFRKMDSDAVMVDLAVAPHGATTPEERRAVSDKMDSMGLGLGSDKFSPEAWVMELLRLRIEDGGKQDGLAGRNPR